jgi:hypothetical protein
LPYLIDLDILSLGLDEQNIGMKSMINLFAGRAMITSISFFRLTFKTIECLGKLKSHELLSNSFTPKKEIAVHDLLIFNRLLEECNGFGVP